MHRRQTTSGCSALILVLGIVVITSGHRLVDATIAAEPPIVAARAVSMQATEARTEYVEPWFAEPGTVLQTRSAGSVERGHGRTGRVTGPKGTRVWTASSLSDHGIPSAALRAYKNAGRTMAKDDPGCQIPWTLLAGIGRVESDHGRYGGSVLARDGVSRPLIIGIALNGKGPVAAIRDTDNGRLDKDKVWDRAVGPMQFIPRTWAGVARDGDGNGVKTPNDIDDAALGAATYLCGGNGSVLGTSSMAAAIYRYNPSDYYVALVMAFETGYRTGVFRMPQPPQVDEPAAHRRKRHLATSTDRARTRRSTQKRSSTPAARTRTTAAKPAPKPAPKPTVRPKPAPAPAPMPAPEPSPPALSGASGQLGTCPAGWCLGSTALDLGPGGQLSRTAAHDFDGDSTLETNQDELSGLVGQSVTLLVQQQAGADLVYAINKMDYRLGDGSFA